MVTCVPFDPSLTKSAHGARSLDLSMSQPRNRAQIHIDTVELPASSVWTACDSCWKAASLSSNYIIYVHTKSIVDLICHVLWLRCEISLFRLSSQRILSALHCLLTWLMCRHPANMLSFELTTFTLAATTANAVNRCVQSEFETDHLWWCRWESIELTFFSCWTQIYLSGIYTGFTGSCTG